MEWFFSINKKGQAWSLDLVVASIIFLIGIAILFNYSLNIAPQSEDKLNEFFYEGNLVGELLLSNEDFGILTNGVVDQTKLDAFDALSDQDKKNLLGVRNNFYFTMEGLASPVGIVNSGSVSNNVKVTRLTVYQDKPAKFEIFIWRI